MQRHIIIISFLLQFSLKHKCYPLIKTELNYYQISILQFDTLIMSGLFATVIGIFSHIS